MILIWKGSYSLSACNYQNLIIDLIFLILKMPKILISWLAATNDFENNRINTNGPTYSFHQHFFKGYDKHILLSTESSSQEYTKGLTLFSTLKKSFPLHQIELRYMALAPQDVINFNLIHAALYPLILEFKQFNIDFFVSPGTPTMQVVWYMLHMEFKANTRLFQTIKKEDTGTGNPNLVQIQFSSSTITDFLIIHENLVKPRNKKSAEEDLDNYCITDKIIPVYKLAKEIALTQKTTVLIEGETGTGKEHVAKFIHKNSSRYNSPYVTVNCAAISPDLLESRLFGYVKGAFTNAIETTDGYFHSANSGTIFLDEIGDINPQMQIALLRVLQEGEIQKVGSTNSEKINLRIIAATNKNLYEECEKGSFRWDLYYRLSVAEISLPPLRQRGTNDIKALLNFFNTRFQNEMGSKRKLLEFTPNAMEILYHHSWPGNIRELQNIVERFYAFGLEIIDTENLPERVKSLNIKSLKLNEVIKAHVKSVVTIFNGNLSKAQKALGIGSINTLKKYLKDVDEYL